MTKTIRCLFGFHDYELRTLCKPGPRYGRHFLWKRCRRCGKERDVFSGYRWRRCAKGGCGVQNA